MQQLVAAQQRGPGTWGLQNIDQIIWEEANQSDGLIKFVDVKFVDVLNFMA